MYINSNEISFQNQLTIGRGTHKLYIHAQALEFYQCETNLTFIFQLSMWNKPSLLHLQQLMHQLLQCATTVEYMVLLKFLWSTIMTISLTI